MTETKRMTLFIVDSVERIRTALGRTESGDVVFLLEGEYRCDPPLTIPANVVMVGAHAATNVKPAGSPPFNIVPPSDLGPERGPLDPNHPSDGLYYHHICGHCGGH